MSNISLSTQMTYSKGGDTDLVNLSNSIAVSGNPRISGRATIGTVEESLALGDVTSVGVCVIQNLDTTNYITIGTVAGQRPIRINAGEGYAFRLSGSSVFAAANTASCDISYRIFSA